MLTDAGVLVGLLDKRDPNFGVCVKAAKTLSNEPLLTTYPCFTEAMYMLGKVGGYTYQNSLWAMRRAGRLLLLELSDAETDRMDALMTLYQNVPMDFADASLVAVAESSAFKRIFTIDDDFYVYRLLDGTALEVVRLIPSAWIL